MPGPEHQTHVTNSVRCAVLTVSDTRDLDTDTSGRLIEQLVIEAGHVVCLRRIVTDDEDVIRRTVTELATAPACRAVLITGGTGIAKRDVTVDVVADLLDKRLDGFGELFRAKSYEQIGSGAMLSRAMAGVIGDTAIFVMPGARGAVQLAMTELILPEIGHVASLLTR